MSDEMISMHTPPKRIVIFGGGTMMHVRNHMALCAPAYGGTARSLGALLLAEIKQYKMPYEVDVRLTKMADSSSVMETNMDVERELLSVLADSNTVGIVFNVALCDFQGSIGDVASGKYAERLQTREITHDGLPLVLQPTPKLLGLVQKLRPDITSVGFKTTANESTYVQTVKSNRMAKEHGITWMLANDTVTRNNMVFRSNKNRPTRMDEAFYNGEERKEALKCLAHHFLKSIHHEPA